MNDAFILDASALLCLLQGEMGADQVIAILTQSEIGSVNLSEVYAKLSVEGGSEDAIGRAIGKLDLVVVPFDEEQARCAGMLRSATRSLGLSLGDRACLALAKQRRATAVTTDRSWGRLPDGLGIAIKFIR